MLTSDAPQALLQPGADITLPGVVPAANSLTRRGGSLVRSHALASCLNKCTPGRHATPMVAGSDLVVRRGFP